MPKKKTTGYTLGRARKITSIHVEVLPGSAMPKDVKERILTKSQARAFLRGYIEYLQMIQNETDDPALFHNARILEQTTQNKLEAIS